MDDTIIVACQTLKQELDMVMSNINCTYPIEWIDSGLHTWPQKLHVRMQEVLDNLPENYKTVLLVIGFCGNSMVSIKSNSRRLVMPLVADCIPMFIGSKEVHKKLGPYTYFFTGGYLDSEKTIVSEFEHMKEKYGEEKAKKYMKQMLNNYKQLTIINTGAFDVQRVEDKISDFSKALEVPINVVVGNLCIIDNLLSGDWSSGDFLVIEPNGEITFEDSLRVGESQSSK